MRTIRVELKQQYGQQVVHPLCDESKLLAQLSGNKTLTVPALAVIKKLGYTVKVAANQPKVL